MFDILLIFRSHFVALVSDIEKAFHQISIILKHRNYLRFLWVDDVFKNSPSIVKLRLARVVFGVTSSPFLLSGTVRNRVSSYHFDPEFVMQVLRSFFVDDFSGGSKTRTAAFELYKKLKIRLLEAQFNFTKWSTNDKQLRLLISQIEGTEIPAAMLYGILWDDENDEFIFNFKEVLEIANNFNITKRNVLEALSAFYDPLGFIQPIVMSMKIFFQKLYIEKLEWDAELSGSKAMEWQKLVEVLKTEDVVRVGRKYSSKAFNEDEIFRTELHGFSNASSLAHGANIYLRTLYKSGLIEVNLIRSKSRVAPMKTITIPRLELLGNLLLSRLMNSVKLALKKELKFDKSYYWTDSKITVSWIKLVEKEYNVFVENRVQEIWNLTDIKESFYVGTLNNPADMITRQNFKNIAKKNVWWHRPSFLINDTKFNEKVIQLEIHLESDIEIQNQSNICLTFHSADKINLTDVVNIEKFSSLLKLTRIIAFICRFMDNLKLRKSNTQNKIQVNPILQPR